ncbi:MAG: hypothetical protein LM577_08900 [Thermoproteaceae archaeon]|jgi:hypothetical protein|nr:hypothetical protein [Thermoproteaceae archaeon]
MGRAEALEVPSARRARRCHVYVSGEPEDEVAVVPLGEVYAVSRAPLEAWHAVPADKVKRFLAALLGVGEEDVGLRC